MRQFDAAESALRLGFGDAEYNLAEMLERAGRKREASEHWVAFAKAAPRRLIVKAKSERTRGVFVRTKTAPK